MNKLAADIIIAPDGGFKGIGTLGDPSTNPVGIFSNFISGIIGVMTIVAIIWAIFVIITGAVSIISSGGDKQALEAARKRITNGVLGLVIVFISLFLVEIIAYFLGIKDILNINALFQLITGGSQATGGGAFKR
jgi:phosphoglycerol transferase MdoB-like AlkP superfamily enzyme